MAAALIALASCGGGGTSLGSLKANPANAIPGPPGAMQNNEISQAGGRGGGHQSYGPTIQRSYTVTALPADVAAWYDTRLRDLGWQPGGYVATGIPDNSGVSGTGGRQYTHGKLLFDVTGFMCIDLAKQAVVPPPGCNSGKAHQLTYETFLSAP